MQWDESETIHHHHDTWVTTPLTPSLSRHHNCDDNNKPLSLVTLFSTQELPWTPRCACFFVKITTNLYVLMLYPLDPLYCHLCSVTRSRRSKWLLRRVVCLHSPILDPLLVYYSHQVCCLPLIHFIHWNYFCLSLHVNLDMGKTVYAHLIMNNIEIPTTIIRTSTLPEELGRITYFLSDKTGTLTQNGIIFTLLLCHDDLWRIFNCLEMEMKKLHMGTMSWLWLDGQSCSSIGCRVWVFRWSRWVRVFIYLCILSYICICKGTKGKSP